MGYTGPESGNFHGIDEAGIRFSRKESKLELEARERIRIAWGLDRRKCGTRAEKKRLEIGLEQGDLCYNI